MDLETYKVELGKTVADKIDQAINNISPMALYQEPNKLKLYIPKIAIDYLSEYCNSLLIMQKDNNKPKAIRYKGYEILIGYELAIILVHDNYALYNEPELISRINL